MNTKEPSHALKEKAVRNLIERRVLSKGGPRPSEKAQNAAVKFLVAKADRERAVSKK